MILERQMLNPKVKEKMVNTIMGELEGIFGGYSANYWMDNAHNIFALLDNDEKIEVRYELYDCNEDIVCDLMVLETENATKDGLLEKVIEVVNSYYGLSNDDFKEELSMNRIDNIKKFAQKKEAEKIAKEVAIQQQIEDYKKKIQTLKPRIVQLIEVGNACVKYGIPLTGQTWGGHEGYDTHQFYTNCWSHLVGFVDDKGLAITYLGIDAGGACGCYDFRTNGDLIYDIHEQTKEIVEPSTYHLKHFLERFDEFESEFYKYVDNITQ